MHRLYIRLIKPFSYKLFQLQSVVSQRMLYVKNAWQKKRIFRKYRIMH